MSRHGNSSTATEGSGTIRSDGETWLWDGERQRERKKEKENKKEEGSEDEYGYDREQSRRRDGSRTPSHANTSQKRGGGHSDDGERAESRDEYEKRKCRREKTAVYPDKESRLLTFVHDVDGVAERLVRRAEYGETGGARKREIRRVVKELEVVYKRGAGGGRHRR